jgi:hypothetical protein
MHAALIPNRVTRQRFYAALLLAALVVSLTWNIRQAAGRSEAVAQSYVAGVEDGEAMLRARIVRRIIELQLIEESQANAKKEKL